MALSDDQKAILRLLNQRGEQGYDDLSALMGISVAEVHRRARQAADQLEEEGIPAPAIPAPPGGGGDEDSPSVAKDGEAPPGESSSPEPPPTAPSEQQEPAPEIAMSTEAPRARPQRPAASEPKSKPERQRRTFKEDVQRLKLLENRGLWAILAGLAIVILFLVFILGGDDGSDGGDTTATTTGSATQALEQAAAREGKEVTKAVFNPVDGSEASGEAVFGRVKNKLALQVLAKGLEQTAQGESYTIWLRASADKMLPLASTPVGEEGQIAAQVNVPVEILAYLANETFGFIAITKTDDSQLEASLAQATKERKAPVYTGTEVLRGEVIGPIVGAADRIEEAEEEGE